MLFSKVANTRAIGPAHIVQGTDAYNPSASSARRTDLSWQALATALADNGGTCTVQQYLDQQKLDNPENIGDALPCFRYWAGSAKVAIADPEPTPEPAEK